MNWQRIFALTNFKAEEVKISLKQGLDLAGYVCLNLEKVHEGIPPRCTLAPQWYKLKNRRGDSVEVWLLMAIFKGYQGDPMWNLSAKEEGGTSYVDLRPDIYFTPSLCYLVVNMLSARNLVHPESCNSQVRIRATLGEQTMVTLQCDSKNPVWNHVMRFVTAEPFEYPLNLTVEESTGRNSYRILGGCVIQLDKVERRSDDKEVKAADFFLHRRLYPELQRGTISMRVFLDGGYHVHHQSGLYSSALTSADADTVKPKIGLLELGILRATGLVPMKTRNGLGTTDAYCVAKCGQKWARTRTISGSLTPMWNETFRWDVFDPCTLVMVGVFDSMGEDGDRVEDAKIGKVRIRLSQLQIGRIHTYSYPLAVIQPNGVQKMGEIELAVKLTCPSWIQLMRTYSQPLLPQMNSAFPHGLVEAEALRLKAVHVVSRQLARSEPPLKQTVVEYLLDSEAHLWSVRRAKIMTTRIMDTSSLIYKRTVDICNWKSTPKTLFVFLCVIVAIFFDMLLSSMLLGVLMIGLFKFFWSPRLPLHMDTNLSIVFTTFQTDFADELDTYPSSQSADHLRLSYEKLRRIGGTGQTILSLVASMIDRISLILSWRDRRATAFFLLMCFIAGAVDILLRFASRYLFSRYGYHVTPSQVVQAVVAVYLMRPPWFRIQGLPWFVNFLLRLPTRDDELLL